jgi:pectin methylesterase-like acyl-CoA thioesterase
VANSGGQFTSVSAALASITDNGPAHRYAIKVAPGTYTEVASVVLKSYVDIEGSGQDLTTITCACGSNTSPAADGSSTVLQVTGPGVRVGIRGLTITNIGSSLAYSAGIVTRTTDPGDVSLDALTITASGGTSNYGIYNDSSSSSMTNVTVTATGGTNSVGIHNSSSSPTMTNVTTTATGGTTTNSGIFNVSSSSPTITNVTATATGGTTNYGILNGSSSSPTMTNTTVTATGGGNSVGIYNSSSSPTMTNVTVTASGGTTTNYGVHLDGGFALIRDSFLMGSTYSVHRNTGTIRILNTVFNGDTFQVGAAACTGALRPQLTDYTCL